MKILQILPELNIGGVERGTIDLARELIRQGHQALIISNGGRLVEELESCGVKHIKLSVHRKSLFSILANIPKVAKILQQEKVDIVHARSRIPALIAYFASRASGTNFITTCHGYYSQNAFSRVMGWGKRVIVSSAVISQHMIDDFGVPRERIRFIPRGVDLEEFKFCQRRQVKRQSTDIFTVGVIGRLTPIKGHRYFLQALARVIRILPKVRALIVGDISPGKEKYKEELLMLTRRLSLDRYVEFLGRQSNIPQVLARLDALVLPTVTQEAFGRVLIEAGACGVPVIASKVGGVVDIIQDGVNGILVQPQDTVSLATAITRLFKEPQLSQKLVLAARKNVEENFSLKQMAQRTIKVYEEALTTLKILVIKLSALGDVILAIPSLAALRENFPQAHIAVLTGAPFSSILQNCPYVNQIIEFPLGKRGFGALCQASSLLRRLDFDIVVDLQNSRRSHILAYLSACNRRYGYANGKWGFLLNRKVKEVKTSLSPVKHQARTLSLLDIKSVKEDLELWPKAGDEAWAEDFLKKHKKVKDTSLIGINLGASAAWCSKRWPLERFAALLDKMQDAKMQVLITGKAGDKELAKDLREVSRAHFINAVDETQVLQLACLIKRCDAYITSDSAPLHIAYAMKTPVVALFGPTDPRRHAIASTKQVVIKKDLPCSPCYRRHCRKHSCMQEISTEEVFEAVKRLL
ncbi:MAG: lipopolysaccharide heptosyltransferase II [Candidatus Omnitrophica bacterium]|nr:lipopolysaccharide heptosyltransferase II [Candidatus Omnitrophota bacterium]